ncbi:zf-DHHC-domain-containing protein [Amylocystis lapponica]|nr:zf-DHHC-domain-containing protein [Amylocystis lapponica]
MGRITGRLFVGFTVSLISFIAYSAQVFIIWPWYGRELSVELITLLVPFNVLVGMLFWNYYLCVVTDPGGVPKHWKPDFRDGDGYEVKKLTRDPRYCRTCQTYKPPRAHHCKQCKRSVESLILSVDHHCPWVNNCIGHFNYGHFIRFLFYVDVACTYHTVMVTRRVYTASNGRRWENPIEGQELILIVLNYVACIPVLVAVGGFSLFHLWSLAGNTTTIEGWEKDKVATLVRHGKLQEIKFPYNIGMRRNIASVLGDKPWLWCWPTIAPGTGLKFQLAEGDDPNAQPWPPEDPTKPYMYPAPDPNQEFTLPPSPWTYENGTLNPNLAPSNARLRSNASQRRKPNSGGPISALPPYHPDYDPQADTYSLSPPSSRAASSADSEEFGHEDDVPHVRRGSEGYEVRPAIREGLLQEYVQSRTQRPGRYQPYVPEPPSEDEDDGEDEVPLAKIEKWRTVSSSP